MRIPGFGGEVLRRNGGIPVSMPGGEIFTALQTGTIDAAEWIGPYNDLAFGMHKVASHYYYPGWHEGGPSLECIINKEALDSLPEDLRTIVEIAIQATNDTMLAEFVARNATALQQIKAMKQIKIKPFPEDVMLSFEKTTDEIISEIETKDPMFSKIYKSFSEYKKTASEWTKISEYALLKQRYKD
jgi:TRAP-type mannitol/chloroaromatic compound transport system substrate-binding protein